MVRVKRTGEVSEVDREVMKILRAEEKRMRRAMTGIPVSGCDDPDETTTLLSLDFVSVPEAEEMSPAWLEDPCDLEDMVITKIMEQEFRALLSERQLDVYIHCLRGGMRMNAYAKLRGSDVSTVYEARNDVREKAKNFF